MQASVSSSAPSVNTPSTPTGPAIPICWDFMNGRCHRVHCRFLHDDPLNMKSRQHENSSLPSGDVAGRLGISPARNVPPPRSLIPTSSQPKPSNAVSPIVIPPSRAEYPPLHTKMNDAHSDIPLVPPGLGLEARILGSDAPTSPKEPPKPAILTVLDATRVTFGPGFEVQRLVTGFESRQVMFRRIPQGVTSAEVTSVLQPFGETVAVTLYDNVKRDGTIAAKATFAEHEQASQAASALDGSLLFGSNISARLLTFSDTMVGKGSLADGTVYLEFPSAHKTGFVGYASRKLAEEAIAKANGTEMREALVSAAIYEGLPSVGTVTVRFLGLPANTRAEELARYGNNEGVMMTQPNYNSTSTAIGRLREILTGYGELLSFNALPPPYRRSTVRVWAHFDSSEIAEIVRVNFHWRRKQFCGSGRIVARHIRSLKYSLPVEVYKALSADIRLLSSYIWTTEASSSISVLDKRAAVGGRVMIKLVSQNMPSLARLKTHFERLLRGEKLVENGEVVWDGFFSRRGGIFFLEELERRFPDVLVNRDPRRRTLALFGPVHKRQIVRSIILTRVARMRAQKTHVIALDGRLIGLFMNADLAALRQQFGPENVIIDLWERVLRIRGDDEAYRVARTAVERARTRHEHERRQRESDCPVCLDEATLPVALDCGHQWCKSCLHNYLLAATDNKVFPLTCLGNEASCKHPIPISTAQELLSTNEFDALVHASFLAYVHSRPSEFHYCPTPDCPQVYRKGRKNTVLQCPSCLVRICPFCHVQYHEGSSCQDREAEDRKLFEEWKKGRDVKDCPSCKAPIERAAGCNHMTCTRCNTHICWACLATFSTGEEVYDHMHNLHGGIGA
ncbi:uncharacterized protein LAESUDRAFT_423546 [Laetiporus sulphureus 93-53]|uniref:RING-type E3 ubiquitin transferase n=1 Tax=Laetiporus sulphureus 93-53 TaxID=1314785 RepID=A0A165GIE4_9APHY|nr:uncharacterized protein LAESUDRAFT_423546 [Laetiporus sulphureus 93-53]KZT10391.1 hypothetical protein LAESUDRAFT_423546 [Laetiporus sulphureus 93-53]